MNKKIYTVKGIVDKDSGEKALGVLHRVIPTVEYSDFSEEKSTLTFFVDLEPKEISYAERQLKQALAEEGFELITPANVEKYAYVGEKKKKTATIPVPLAISLIAAVSAFCILVTFILSGGFYAKTDTFQPNIQHADTSELPSYTADLVKLDEVFRAYSYEGVDEEVLAEAMLKAYITATGDPYAEYMTAEEFEAYNSESAGEFVGVGISIVNSNVTINGYTYKAMQIISVFDGSPALENDVRVGDYIVYAGIDEDRVLVDIIGYTEALAMLLGQEGTNAEFTVFRPDKTEDIGFKEIKFSIERKKVITESVKYRVSETDSRVGIVNITNFDQTTAVQFTEAVDTLLDMGCEYFVFDVRNNPGGALASIEAVLSYFLDRGDLIIGIEYSDGTTEEGYVSVKNYGSEYEGYNVSRSDIGKYKGLKSVVITNENTASAAELFTATFRDYGLAEIVGKKTFGKGCMQSIIPLERYGLEGGLRVTTAMYFSKSYKVYHNIGIEPDHNVELSEEALEYNFYLLPEGKDAQLQKAIEILLK